MRNVGAISQGAVWNWIGTCHHCADEKTTTLASAYIAVVGAHVVSAPARGHDSCAVTECALVTCHVSASKISGCASAMVARV
mmetsp:Transcript_48579/g.89493  ORF Transcript_48579/g.89493 Transcript_48579/m.89493 type:complete len:82 (-) Transcript_48579:74-319(-)